jgi:hypothetical protein
MNIYKKTDKRKITMNDINFSIGLLMSCGGVDKKSTASLVF